MNQLKGMTLGGTGYQILPKKKKEEEEEEEEE